MNRQSTDILIVGGGPAGMSAALSAAQERDVKVTVVDDNPRLGGQIWRAELGKIKSREATALIDALDQKRIAVINNASVFAADDDSLLAETPSGQLRLDHRKLILATGARELFLPFPGWTLGNVFGAAGLQALVKGGLDVAGRRVVVAGTGPLLLVVAEYLQSKGARVAAICEQTSNSKLDRFAIGLWRSPSKVMEGLALRGRLRGVPYYRNSWVLWAQGTDRVERVTIQRFDTVLEIECDTLACGFHLVPNIELAQLLGCSLNDGFVTVDDHQRTSVANVYCAGEPTGIGGVEASIVEGKIAGYAATGQFSEARALSATRRKTRAFTRALARTFALNKELRNLPNGSTIVCRCEDVRYAKLKHQNDFRTAKLQTRCGMGSCQGRICGAAVDFLFGWKDRSVRPPIVPVKMENL